MNVSRNSWSVTKVRLTINLLLSVNDSGCQKIQCSERQAVLRELIQDEGHRCGRR